MVLKRTLLVLLILIILTSCTNFHNSKNVNVDKSKNQIINEFKEQFNEVNYKEYYTSDDNIVLVHYFDKNHGKSYFHFFSAHNSDYYKFVTPSRTEVLSYNINELKFIQFEKYGGEYYGHLPEIHTYKKSNNFKYELLKSEPKSYKLIEKLNLNRGKTGELKSIAINFSEIQFVFGPLLNENDLDNNYFAGDSYPPVTDISYNVEEGILKCSFVGFSSNAVVSSISKLTYDNMQPIKNIIIESEESSVDVYISIRREYADIEYYPKIKRTIKDNYPIFAIEWKF